MKYADQIKKLSLLEKCALLSGSTVFETHALLGHAIPEDHLRIDQTMTLGELNHSRSPLCWLVWVVLHTLLKQSSRKGTPDLNLLFLYNMPLRALGQMTGGTIGQETVDGIVMEAKGFWIIGILRALIGLVQNAVGNRSYRARLDALQKSGS